MTVACPRCGAKGSFYVRKDGYMYVQHYENGRVRKCYIGPVKGYVHAVSLYNVDMGHVFDIDHLVKVLDGVLNRIAIMCRENKKDGGDGKIMCSREHVLKVQQILERRLGELRGL